MCLLIEALLPGVPSVEAGDVTHAAVRAGVLELHAQRQRRGTAGSRFLISEPGERCACSLAGDDADWDAPTYALRADAAEPLARTLEFLLDRAGPDGLLVRAAWVSAAAAPFSATDASPVSASALLAEVRQARIANNRAYRVRSSAA